MNAFDDEEQKQRYARQDRKALISVMFLTSMAIGLHCFGNFVKKQKAQEFDRNSEGTFAVDSTAVTTGAKTSTLPALQLR